MNARRASGHAPSSARSLHSGDDGRLDDERTGSLVERCRGGDQEAWRALVEAHVDYVAGAARRLGTPVEELDDVCQEVFLVVWRRLDQFGEGRFTTWLYRIAANVAAGRHRRRRRRRRLGEALALLVPRSDPGPGPEARAQGAEARRQVDDVLESMSDRLRDVFVLFELEGLAGADIAERVGCSPETVRTRLFHARRQFRRIAVRRRYLQGDD